MPAQERVPHPHKISKGSSYFAGQRRQRADNCHVPGRSDDHCPFPVVNMGPGSALVKLSRRVLRTDRLPQAPNPSDLPTSNVQPGPSNVRRRACNGADVIRPSTNFYHPVIPGIALAGSVDEPASSPGIVAFELLSKLYHYGTYEP